MTVGRLMREMTVKEFAYWQIHYREDPFGEDRADLRAAQGHALLANINRDPKKHEKPFEVIDFMPYAKRRDEATKAEKVEQEGVKVDPMTLTWLLWKSRQAKKHGK